MCAAVAAASAGMIAAALAHATTAEAVIKTLAAIDEMIVGVTFLPFPVIDAMIAETTDVAVDFGATAARAAMDPVTPALHLVSPTNVGPCYC